MDGLSPEALVLGGAVSAMAFGALMVFVSRRNDLVALFLGGFLACIAASLVAAPVSRTAGLLAIAFLAAFLAELRPAPWPRRAAIALAVAGVAAAALGAQVFAQVLAAGVAAWACVVALQLVRERRTSWPVVIAMMALGYPVLTLGLFSTEGLEPAGFIAYVVAPGLILTRRAIRAFDAEARRSYAQEQALVLERRRLDLVVRAARVGIVDWNGRTHRTFYSPRFKEILGYPGDADAERFPDYFKVLIHPEDRERVTGRWREFIAGKGPEGARGEYYSPEEYRLLRMDGSYAWVQVSGMAVRDEAGFVTQWIAAVTDVSERRRQEDALRNQAKFTADVIDSVPVALSMRDPDGRYQFVNRTWEKYYGNPREKVIGTSPRERASPQEADALLAMDKAAIEAGTGNPTQPMDYKLGDKHYLQSRTAMADAGEKLLGVLTASIDVTERQAMEQALAAEQRRFELVVRAANVGILDWDGVTRTVWYSPRFKEILRHAGDADTSRWPDYWDLVHPEDQERVSGAFRSHIFGKGGEGLHDLHQPIQYRLRRADGSHVWIEAVGASVRDANGYATRFIAAIEDISERRFQEDALRSAVRLREEVERMSRHDLKTPLNSVIAMARFLRESGKLGREDGELLGSIERAGYRILNMVNLSLDLFRMESGTYEFRPQPVDVAKVAQRVAADLEAQAASKKVEVEVGVDGGPAGQSSAFAEELLCYSMLANLIKNAIEASPDGRVVTVRCRAERNALSTGGDTLLTEVHNAGAVREEMRERFFQKYATAGKSGGVGLGAYSARLMARVQQGDITLRTSDEDGTTVTIRLALAPPAAAATAAAAGDRAGEAKALVAAGPKRRVLVADDDEFNRLVLRHFLPSPPFEVDLTVNGRAALESARRDWPDAVLLDLEMPVMDGYQAAQELRALEREGGRKRLTIIAISSNDEEKFMQRALEAGCDHYLIKPAGREALLRLLQAEASPHVDPDLKDVMPAFVASRRVILDELPEALAAGDRTRFRKLAHKLAGSFVLYGFDWAADQCRDLERDAEKGDAGDLTRRARGVRAHLDEFKVEAGAK